MASSLSSCARETHGEGFPRFSESVMKGRNVKKRTNPPLVRGPGDRRGAARGERSRATSFVMVLWLEGSESLAEPQWRWRVVEALSGERRYFHRLSDVLAYVSERAGASPPT